MFADEELLKRKKLIRQMAEEAEEKQVEEEIRESIFNGSIHIYGEEFFFERRDLPEAGIRMLMPVIFEEVDEETRKAVFPMGRAPKPVYSSDRDLFNIAVKRTEHKVPQDHILEFTGISCQLLERMGPQAKILKKYTHDAADMKIGVMEFLTMAIDGRLYTINCLFPFEEGVVIVSFSFLSKVRDRIRPILMEMIQSIEFLEEG